MAEDLKKLELEESGTRYRSLFYVLPQSLECRKRNTTKRRPKNISNCLESRKRAVNGIDKTLQRDDQKAHGRRGLGWMMGTGQMITDSVGKEQEMA